MYVPIVLAALAFGVPGCVLAGVCDGLLLGPFMPLDTLTREMHRTLNRSYRLTVAPA